MYLCVCAKDSSSLSRYFISISLFHDRHDMDAERAQQEATAREHNLQSELVAERGKTNDLERAKADLRWSINLIYLIYSNLL